MRKPFYWKRRKAWFLKTEDLRSQVYLAENEQDAHRVWAEMVAAGRPIGADALLAAVVEEYLTHAEKAVAESTYSGIAYYLADFSKLHGFDRVRDLLPLHVTKWLNSHPAWGPASFRAAITSIKRALAWAVEQGMIATSPLANLRRPGGRRREQLVSADNHKRMVGFEQPRQSDSEKEIRRTARRDGAFRAVMIALRHSGARPGTIAAVRVEHIAADFSCWTLPEHKTRKKTGRPLVVYLSPCLAALTRVLVAGRAEGPLFRDSRGKAWTPNGIRCRMRRLRERLDLPAGTVAYSYRHSYATNAILAGTDVATVAELLGHTDAAMVSRVYGHLAGATEHLKRAAARAVREVS